MAESISRAERGRQNMRVTLAGAGTNVVLFSSSWRGASWVIPMRW